MFARGGVEGYRSGICVHKFEVRRGVRGAFSSCPGCCLVPPPIHMDRARTLSAAPFSTTSVCPGDHATSTAADRDDVGSGQQGVSLVGGSEIQREHFRVENQSGPRVLIIVAVVRASCHCRCITGKPDFRLAIRSSEDRRYMHSTLTSRKRESPSLTHGGGGSGDQFPLCLLCR